jgi:hypothetical protein
VTHRQARKSFGSRTTRRAGTKTKIIPGGNGKRPPKSRYFHRRKTRLSVRVAAKVKASRAAA